MGAAENNEDAWNGLEAGTGESGNNTNVPLGYAWVPGRGRVVGNLNLRKSPFSWPIRTTPQTTSRYDQTQLSAEQLGGRYVDSVGNVWDDLQFRLVQIELLVMGASVPPTSAELAQAIANSNVLRDWPTGFPGAFPGEPQETYPAWPPAGP
jgi:hypothetical protein